MKRQSDLHGDHASHCNAESEESSLICVETNKPEVVFKDVLSGAEGKVNDVVVVVGSCQ